MTIFENFQQIPPLGRSEYAQPPIIEDQDVDLGNRFEKTGVTTIPPWQWRGLRRGAGHGDRQPPDRRGRPCDCAFRGIGAVISRDRGRLFHGIAGSHFAVVGRLVHKPTESGLKAWVKGFRGFSAHAFA